MSAALGSAENPVRVAVIGSGPAGFYAAGQLLSSTDPVVKVDVFDRLMTPWGLVRFGVAPDHPKIKSVTRVFERTAKLPGFCFHGNVEVGTDVSHEELAAAYHAVLYAVGTPGDRRLGIPGEDLPGSESATEFVAWYNGHPDYAEMDFDLSCKRAVVIGAGNVALDVARMLALSVDELQVTDIADHSIELLRDSNIEEIVVLGRRGPAQAAFTNPELRELAELELADVIVDPADVELDPASAAALETADGTIKRNVETLAGYSRLTPSGKPRRVVLRFLTSPVAIEGSDRVQALVVERNELVTAEDGSLKARPTGVTERLETGIVLRAVGYVGKPLPGVPFGDRHPQPDTGAVRRRLDQARPLRRDRHQQEVRAGDHRPAARGLRRRAAAGAQRHARGAARTPARPCRGRRLLRLAGDRCARARPGRAQRPPAREAGEPRRAAPPRRRGTRGSRLSEASGH
jgi:ferredoxin--NADP+ reductase